MMNHHLPPMPHGKPPMPPPRRQHDVPYTSSPPNMRPTQGYMGYHHPHSHANAPTPQFGPQPYQPWYPYQQMPHHPPPPPAYHPYSPLIVSSNPRPQHPIATAPPPSISGPPITTSSTTRPSLYASTPPSGATSSSAAVDSREDVSSELSVKQRTHATNDLVSPGLTSSSGAGTPPIVAVDRSKELSHFKQQFQPPVSLAVFP